MKLILLVIGICVSESLFCQTAITPVQIPRAKTATYRYAQVEPSLAINPKNPLEMAVGTVLDDYYYTTDGGLTWTSKTLKSKYGVNGDPVLTFDTHGNLYYFHLSQFPTGSYLDRIVCQKAKKVNRKFSKGTYTSPNGTKAQDKEWVVYDSKTDCIYMTWTQFDAYDSKKIGDSSVIMFSKSCNQGKNWSTPKRISTFAGTCLDDNNTLEGAFPSVGVDGNLYVVWSGPKGLYLQRSEDLGETWLQSDQIIGTQAGGWNLKIPGLLRCNGFPILKCDQSNGPNRGRLYLNWTDQRNGVNNTDSWLMYSDDGGKNWSEPSRVNQDSGESHQFFTWMDIDKETGKLYFVYYDRRNYSDNQTDVYGAISLDGGATFREVKLSNSPFTPSEDVFFGDYLSTAVDQGIVRAVWPRMDGGKISLWFGGFTEN